MRASLVLLHRHLVQKSGLVLDYCRGTEQGGVAQEVFAPLVVEAGGFDLHFVDFVDQDGLVGCKLIVVVLELVLEAPFIFIH